jgi:hypothetical protein
VGTTATVTAAPTPSLTDVQRRTLERLIDGGRLPVLSDGFPGALERRLEIAVREAGIDERLVLTKARLSDAGRCEGRFESALLREAPPFEHSAKTASGLVVHKAVELDVGARSERDAYSLAELAASRLADDDDAFATYWAGVAETDRDQLLMRATTALVLFRETFPPLRVLRARLTPMTEWRLRAELAGGLLVLDGRIDLSLGRPADPSGRLLLDIKGAGAWPEHAEDLRFYALVHFLRFGAAPSRVASVFLSSGTWQVEDVTERVLVRAAERIEAAIVLAGRLRGAAAPSLAPGRYCSWCPRVRSCPAASGA